MGRLNSSSPFFRPGPPARIGEASPEILAFITERAEGRILDLGGGRGAYAQALRERGLDVTVGEKDPECLAALAVAGIPNLDMNSADWNALKGRFDTVLLIEVLEHVEDYAAFLANAMACARRKLLLTVPCNDDFERLFSYGLTFNHIAVSDHVNQFTSGDIESLLKVSGWKYRVRTGGHFFPGGFLFLMADTLRGNLMGSLALWPLRIAARLGWLPKRFPGRIFAEASAG